jgi:predicted metalloendopeptidase
MDPTADPCQDFYQYTCGNWAKITKIPDEKDWYSSQHRLYDSNKENMIKVRIVRAKYDTFLYQSRVN